jgi:hypothetical protein
MIVKRIGVASVARIYGAISGSIGLLIGIIVALASMIGAGMSETTEGAIFAPIMGVGAIIVFRSCTASWA